MPDDKETCTESVPDGIRSALDTNLSGMTAQDLQEVSSKIEAIRKGQERTLALRRVSTFLILLVALAVPSLLLLTASGSVEAESGKEVIAVIGGLVGLLASVGIHKFIEERERRMSIRKLRISKKEFFDRIKQDFSSRLAEKVR